MTATEGTSRTAFRAPDEVDRDAWRAAALGARSRHVDVLPEVALDPAAGLRRPLLYRHEPPNGDAGALALLEPRRVRLARAPGIRRATALAGLRVVGDDLFGDVTPEQAAAFVRDACDLLEAKRADCLLFEDLDSDSALAAAIEDAARRGRARVFRPTPPQPHWYIRFPDPPEAYWKQLSGKARYKLRRKARRLEHRALAIRSRADVPRFLDAAQRISESSWQGRRLGLRVRNDADERRHAEILADLGALRCYLLEAPDGAPIAFVKGWQWRGLYAHEETAYDSRYAPLSAGIVLQYRLLEDLLTRDPPRILDFGAGDSEYKRGFANERGESGRAVLLRRSGRPTVAYGVGRAWRASDRRARALLQRTGLYSVVRRRYRRQA